MTNRAASDHPLSFHVSREPRVIDAFGKLEILSKQIKL